MYIGDENVEPGLNLYYCTPLYNWCNNPNKLIVQQQSPLKLCTENEVFTYTEEILNEKLQFLCSKTWPTCFRQLIIPQKN